MSIMTKKCVTLLLAVLIAALLLPARSNMTEQLTITIGSIDDAENGSTVTLPVTLTGNADGVTMLQFTMDFDPDELQFIEAVQTGTIISGADIDPAVITDHIIYIWESATPVTENGIIVYLKFNYTPQTTEPASVTFDKTEDYVVAEGIDEDTQQPIITPNESTDGSVSPHEYQSGDVDMNKAINVADLYLIMTHLSDGEQLTGLGLENADMNVDSSVSLIDAVMLARFLVAA